MRTKCGNIMRKIEKNDPQSNRPNSTQPLAVVTGTSSSGRYRNTDKPIPKNFPPQERHPCNPETKTEIEIKTGTQ